MVAVGLVTAVTLGACGSDGEQPSAQQATSTTSTEAPQTAVTPGADGYTPVSDVAPHAAIGLDAKEIRSLMEPATSDGEVDWEAVGRVFTEGKNSKKAEGLRTLATLAPDDPATAMVLDAIRGTGSAAGASAGVRRQKVDKGIVVILERKVLAELEAASKKVADNKTDAATGAPHNVDEAWAFYTAEGNGPAATATKRANDFKKEGQVHEAVIKGLSSAQAAASSGDAAGLEAATAEVEAALDYVFYLATFKYLDTKNDPVTRAEGETFYLGIQSELAKEAPEADKAIRAAFASGDAQAGRSALNSTAALEALGVSEQDKVESMP